MVVLLHPALAFLQIQNKDNGNMYRPPSAPIYSNGPWLAANGEGRGSSPIIKPVSKKNGFFTYCTIHGKKVRVTDGR